MLQLDIQQIISQGISFLLLLYILRRFAWKPLLGALDARRAKIEHDLQSIAQGKADLATLQTEYQGRLNKIEEEARAKIQEAVSEGKRIAAEVQEQARAQASGIIAKSKETVELELAKARVTLRDQVAQMTTDAVEKILRASLNEKTDHKLVDSVLDELEQGGARG
jgi:F-type H+-transporting ATPase subunit b